ncbi:hypothetical protein CDAR_300191 [Caerostris darwini]|uniref:Uncharacterized protein n=1 Tax=Caerostris darwini TaxID=1538125 RepID=A0AAV4W430_9ARAC|nr:hypothetical protein CDAR_300191 [Caerostris darwini]
MNIFSCRTACKSWEVYFKGHRRLKSNTECADFTPISRCIYKRIHYDIPSFQKDIIISRRTHIRGHGVVQLTKSVSSNGIKTHFVVLIAEFPGNLRNVSFGISG